MTPHPQALLRLQGDPRDAIISFVREEGLDLLLVGRSLGGRFKKVPRCLEPCSEPTDTDSRDLMCIDGKMGPESNRACGALQAFTPGGTVSQHVVSHASCPVLVLPAKAVS